MSTRAVQARRPRALGLPTNAVDFGPLVQRLAKERGPKVAAEYAAAVLKAQRDIDMAALERALRSGKAERVAQVLGLSNIQQQVSRAVAQPLTSIAQAAGQGSAALMSKHGVRARFDAVHPDVVQFARLQGSDLVTGIDSVTRDVIREVVARGAEGHLTVADQARAIREVVGLPKPWAMAPARFEAELRAGRAGAATSRRLSAVMQGRLRKAIRTNTLTDALINEAREEYSAGLVHLRAKMIARTESARAAHHGLQESWKQAQRDGVLPASTRRWWIVTPDERLSRTHATIPSLNPKGRKLDEPFVTTEGLHMFPPSRPNCRCRIALTFGGAELRDAERAAGVEIARRDAAAGVRRQVGPSNLPAIGILPASLGDIAAVPTLPMPPDVLPSAPRTVGRFQQSVTADEFPLSARGQMPLARGAEWRDLDDIPKLRRFAADLGSYDPDRFIAQNAVQELEKIISDDRFILGGDKRVFIGLQNGPDDLARLRISNPDGTLRFNSIRTAGVDIERAQRYAGDGGMTLEVVVPRGSRALHASVEGYEEWQFLPGTRYEVLEERVTNGRTHYVVRMVDDGSAHTKAIVDFKHELAREAGRDWEAPVARKLSVAPSEPLAGSKAWKVVEDLTAAARIDDPQRQAMRRYSTKWHRPVNRQLRGLPDDPTDDFFPQQAVDQVKDQIDKVFAKARPLDDDIVVWRGTKLPPDVMRVGTEFVDNGFVSTAIERTTANDFVLAGEGTHLVRITVPKGSRVVAVGPEVSAHSWEHEVLLQRGGTFRVTAVDDVAKTIDVEYIPPKTARATVRTPRTTRHQLGPEINGGTVVTDAQVEAAAEEATRLGISPRAITFEKSLGNAQVGDYEGRVLGEFSKGRIKLVPNDPGALRQTVAHEATHMQWQVAVRTDAAIVREVSAEWKAFAKDDGITAYSRAHWKAWEQAQAIGSKGAADLFAVAIEETLAEMRAMAATGRAVGTRRYQQLLKRVDAAYRKASQNGATIPIGARRDAAKRLKVEQKVVDGKKAFAQARPNNFTLDTTMEVVDKRAPSISDRSALREYVSGQASGNELNAFLRGTLQNADASVKLNAKLHAQRLTEVLKSRAPQLTEDITVYRGTVAPKATTEVGTVFSDKGFVSTTPHQKAALDFLPGGQYVQPGTISPRGFVEVRYTIRVPSGTRVLGVSGDDFVGMTRAQKKVLNNVNEIILPSNSKFRVVESTPPGRGRRYYEVTLELL